MENKINIAELLKDCPKGMELDCTMFENVTFEEVVTEIDCDGNKDISIVLLTHYNDGIVDEIILTEYGTYTYDETAKCVIFPKGKTTWEGFIPHGQFKDGDIVASSLGNIHILKNSRTSYIYVDFAHNSNGSLCKSLTTCVNVIRFATEEEKQKLFDAIKANGYKWNAETKTLEKLPKFKVGNKVKCKINQYEYTIVNIKKDVYIMHYKDNKYDYHVPFRHENNYELIINKFDINTLKAFDKVLYKMHQNGTWLAGFYNVYIKNKIIIIGVGAVPYCIPYKNNEYLLGTTNDCDDFYKI